MAGEQNTAGTGAESSGQAGGTSAGAGATTGGTTTQSTAEAAAGGKGEAYWKAEAEKAFAARDAAKKNFLESDEGRALSAAAAEAAQLKAAQKTAEEEAAKKRGEFEQLYNGKAKELEDLKVSVAERERKARETTLRTVLSAKAQAAGCSDLETFDMYAERAVAKGEIKADDAGQVTGIEEFIGKLKAAKPAVFTGTSGGTLAGGVGTGETAAERAAKALGSGKRGSLAMGPVLTQEERQAHKDNLFGKK